MLRILLVVDVVYSRDGLVGLLRTSPEVTVVGAVSNCDVTAAIETLGLPDLVLLDNSAPAARATLSMLLARTPAPKVVALTADDDPRQIVEWIEAGAAGYVPRSASVDDILSILIAAQRGETRCSP